MASQTSSFSSTTSSSTSNTSSFAVEHDDILFSGVLGLHDQLHRIHIDGEDRLRRRGMLLEVARNGGCLLAVHLKDDGAMLARRDFHIHIVHVCFLGFFVFVNLGGAPLRRQTAFYRFQHNIFRLCCQASAVIFAR